MFTQRLKCRCFYYCNRMDRGHERPVRPCRSTSLNIRYATGDVQVITNYGMSVLPCLFPRLRLLVELWVALPTFHISAFCAAVLAVSLVHRMLTFSVTTFAFSPPSCNKINKCLCYENALKGPFLKGAPGTST